MFWILMGVLEDDNEDWVIGVVDQVVCTSFKVLEGVIGIVNQVMYVDFNITGEMVFESRGVIFKLCFISAGILRR